VLADKY